MTDTRRQILRGMLGLVCAPAIVRASSLMAIKVMRDEYRFTHVSIALGYAITREAMDANLYGNTPFRLMNLAIQPTWTETFA